mmetsp:Transcript_21041/g.58534  ORF Transcript_21041/g.58534 Transcript_21041/m.58534 type:complete len:117 (-) Transcript_21041:218-568(-)
MRISQTENLAHLLSPSVLFLTVLPHITRSTHLQQQDKEYAGHDITLAIGLMKTDDKWLDRFVKMEEKWTKDAEGWKDYMTSKYPTCGKLAKWDEDPETWPELTPEEKEELNKCVIM